MEVPFVGREKELVILNEYAQKHTASFIVIHGRRRIGKSRLIDEFGKNKTYYRFAGLSPGKGVSAQTQRDEFARKLNDYFALPGLKADEWADLFSMLAIQCKRRRVVILFDEITWMAMDDPTFLGKLKNAWDREFKQHNKLMLILCGSVSAWIEKNILSSTGFLGRIHYVLTLKELSLKASMSLLPDKPSMSAYEKLKFLSVTGGVPLYLEAYDDRWSSEENIKRLCFKHGGLLVREFENIFSDLFGKYSQLYADIVNVLANGALEIKQIAQKIEKNQTGWLSEILGNLEKSGFITRDYSWNLKTGDDGKFSRYRLSDNYLRFYLKYIKKNLSRVKRNLFDDRSLSSLPGWTSVLGYQIENIVLNNRESVWKALGIYTDEIINDNPYFQRETSKQKSCQIDYMIQTKFNNLYVGEIKCSSSPISASVIREVQEKIKRMNIPKGFSCRAFLIHVNGVTDELIEQDYFSKIISFEELSSIG